MRTKGYMLKSKKTHKAKLNGTLFRTVEDAITYAKIQGLRNYYTVKIVTL
jgi:hypothetical protein